MDILDLILARRTVHEYSSKPVPDRIVENALLAAIHAPNHKLTWPWRFFTAGPKTRLALAQIQVEMKSKKSPEPLSPKVRDGMTDKFMKPSHLLVLAIKKSASAEQQKEDYAALACAVQNMSLYLAAEGVGSKWSTGPATRAEKTYEILGVNPQELELCGWFWIGYAEGEPRKPERPSLDGFVQKLL